MKGSSGFAIQVFKARGFQAVRAEIRGCRGSGIRDSGVPGWGFNPEFLLGL